MGNTVIHILNMLELPTNNVYVFLFFPIHAKFPVHLILLDFIILIILGEENKSRSSSFCSLNVRIKSMKMLAFLSKSLYLFSQNTVSLLSRGKYPMMNSMLPVILHHHGNGWFLCGQYFAYPRSRTKMQIADSLPHLYVLASAYNE
jgi:uncharacterized protein involved in cysteine biosynthesis